MPELPEVETMRRGIACVAGSRISAVERPRCTLRPITLEPGVRTLRRRMVGARIKAVERLGKRVILRLDQDHRLVFEPRMTGLVLLTDPPDPGHLRLRLRLEGGPAPELLFWDRRGLGTVRLYDPDAFAERLGPPRLGPDALEITAEQLRERLGASRRAIKVALLDQAVLAGVGNIYASESLNRAKIHPETACRELRPAQWRRLQGVVREVLEEAIRYEGSTLNDGTYRTALNTDGQYQNAHRVYAREGERCRSCQRGVVRRVVQAQRATFFCPRCQKA
jgi:formamidopyrimidine-DNA glycosylase